MDINPHNSFDVEPPGRRPPKLWHGLLLLAVVIALLIFVFSYAQAYWGLWGMVLTEVGIAAVTLLFVLIFKADIKAVFPLGRVKARHVPGALLTWGGTYLITLGVSIFLMILFPGMTDRNSEVTGFLAQDSAWLRVLSVSILPGICEEMMHRGFILAGSGRISRVWVRVLYMGLVFGVFHADAYRFIPTAMLGLALSYIMIRTQNILLPMICHAVNNFIGVLATLFMDSGVVNAQTTAAAADQMSFFQGALLVGLGIFPLAAGWALLRDTSQKMRAAPLIAAVSAAAVLFIGGIVSAVMAPVYNGAFTYAVSGGAVYEETFSLPVDYPAYAYEFEYYAARYLCEAVLVEPGGTEAIRFGPDADFTESGTLVDLAAGEYTLRVSFSPREANTPPEEVVLNFRLKITWF